MGDEELNWLLERQREEIAKLRASLKALKSGMVPEEVRYFALRGARMERTLASSHQWIGNTGAVDAERVRAANVVLEFFGEEE